MSLHMDFEGAPGSFEGDLRWQDVVQTASGINPLGPAGTATIETNTGLLSFSGTADNVAAGVWQLPHGYARTEISPHVHLRFPTAASGKNTRWLFEYDIASVNSTWANASGSYTTHEIITVANPNSVNKHVLGDFTNIDISSYGDSACMLWRLTRLASSTSNDDDTNACLLVSIDLHLQYAAAGSRTETGGV